MIYDRNKNGLQIYAVHFVLMKYTLSKLSQSARAILSFKGRLIDNFAIYYDLLKRCEFQLTVVFRFIKFDVSDVVVILTSFRRLTAYAVHGGDVLHSVLVVGVTVRRYVAVAVVVRGRNHIFRQRRLTLSLSAL